MSLWRLVIPELDDFDRRLKELEKKMATTAEQLVALQAKVDSLKTETTGALERVAKDVKDLQDKLAQQNPDLTPQITAIGNGIDGVIASLKALDPVADAPPAPPPVGIG